MRLAQLGLSPPLSRKAFSAVSTQANVSSQTKPRRRFGRFLLRFIIIVLVLVVAGSWWAVARIPHIDPSPDLSAGTGTQTFLLVGSDSRADLPDDLDGAFGDFGGERSDVVILARPSGGTLQLLSLPRDLKVDIPGHGTNKINAAYAFGGSALLAETVTGATGITVNHVVEIDFAGFAELVDSVGGVDLDFPYSARDAKSGLAVEAGTSHVDGATALAFARSRSYQELRDGSWVSVDADDIGRTGRQQLALEALLKKAASVNGIVRLPLFMGAMSQSVRVDKGLNAIDAATAGFGMWRADVDGATVPVRFSNEGGVSYVVFDGADATAMLQRFLDGQPLSEQPTD